MHNHNYTVMCYNGIGGEETDRGRKVGGQVGMVGRKWHGRDQNLIKRGMEGVNCIYFQPTTAWIAFVHVSYRKLSTLRFVGSGLPLSVQLIKGAS